MDKVSQQDIDWLLEDPLNKSASGKTTFQPKPEKKKKGVFRRLLFWACLLLSMVIFPFLLLIRLSVYLNLEQQWNGWASLAAAAAATVVLVLVYLLILFRRVKNKKRLLRFSSGIASSLVAGFCLYGLMYLSSVHAKTPEIREVYRSMHPILRVAVATTTLADGDLVITDISREPDDYTAMGLPVNNSSLHYPQADGYVYAIDLRTIGRNEWRNKILEYSLTAIGFKTIRHTGTADHLHVALPLPK